MLCVLLLPLYLSQFTIRCADWVAHCNTLHFITFDVVVVAVRHKRLLFTCDVNDTKKQSIAVDVQVTLEKTTEIKFMFSIGLHIVSSRLHYPDSGQCCVHLCWPMLCCSGL